MNRGFGDAVGPTNEMLAAALARQLEPVYCVKCGSRLQVRSVEHKGFDKDTGYRKYDIVLACRYVALYKTDISREARLVWKTPFNRHSVLKVSKIIELNSDITDAYYKPGDAMSFCPDCGTKVSEGALFCSECGKRLLAK